VKDKPPLDTLPAIQNLLAAAEADLSGKGRVLLRYSGTEPKIRLLIEGRDQAAIDAHADCIAEALQAEIGEG
jgi:phosphoglucosamine mutase